MIVPSSPYSASIDTRLRIAGPLVLFLTGLLFFRLQMYLSLSGEKLLYQIIIALVNGYIGWELARITAMWIEAKRPGLSRMRERLYLLVVALVVLCHIGYAFRRIIHIIVDGEPWRWPSLFDYSGTTGVVLYYTTVTLCIYEGGYLWKEWKQSTSEKEKLIQSEWQTKYDLLKTQINPHFLFNSLNSLSSLITENPPQAEKFADEMSNVYRYLLRSNDADLATLSGELKFIRSYGNLLTTRYGEGFHLDIAMPDAELCYLLPSLTLQLLVENAVKHNMVSKEKPLKVTIGLMNNDQLYVVNNVQKKSASIHSSGVGLVNINTKLRLLNKPPLQIEETQEKFKVIVPLIKDDIQTS